MFTESGNDDLTYVYYVDVEDTDGTTGTFDISSTMIANDIIDALHDREPLFMYTGYNSVTRALHAVEDELWEMTNFQPARNESFWDTHSFA